MYTALKADDNKGKNQISIYFDDSCTVQRVIDIPLTLSAGSTSIANYFIINKLSWGAVEE